MRLARWLDGGRARAVVRLDDGPDGDGDWFDVAEVLDAGPPVPGGPPPTTWACRLERSSRALLEALPLLHDRVAAGAGGLDPAWRRPADAVLAGLVAPVWGDVTIYCASLNYHSHIQETGRPVPERPQFFLKPPRCVIGPGDDVVLPVGSDRPDYEAELAVVIGAAGKHVDEADALDLVAGYTIIDDISFRDLQLPADLPGTVDWVSGKALDTAAPTGPWIVTADAVGDPQDIGFRLWIGDDLRQDGHTSDMVFGVRRLIAELTRGITLQPGDVIATGTCKGVGNRTGRLLRDGDKVTIEVDHVGRLVHGCVAEQPPAQRN